MIVKGETNMNNDDKLREQMKSEPVPDRLKPENIKIMLDNEAPKKKRSGISIAGRIAAAAAACTVIGGTAAYTLNNGKFNKNADVANFAETPAQEKIIASTTQSADTEINKQASYMSGAKSYDQVYTMFKESAQKAKKESDDNYYKYETVEEADEAVVSSADAMPENGFSDTESLGGKGGGYGAGGGSTAPEVPIIDGELPTEPETDPVEPTTETVTEDTTEAPTEPVTEEPTTEADPEHSETYYQEQDVLEADIVKTDGKRIYYVGSGTNEDDIFSQVLRVADVKDGKFTSSTTIDIGKDVGVKDDDHDSNIYVTDMYIYNDMIAILGTNYIYDYNSNYSDNRTFVAFYTTGDKPELIDIYSQNGYYNDVRISPDGYMLLISDYSTCNFEELEGSDNIEKYIPCYGLSKDYGAVAAEDILLPNEFGSGYWLQYSVIGSIDLNKSGAPKVHDIKTLAGYSGSIYCSADNLYSAAGKWDNSNTTDITRISVKGGDIEPQAGCTINGWVKDQFSMSEYNGCFRVAATYTEYRETFHRYTDDEGFFDGLWGRITGDEEGYYSYETIKKDNRVYVFDMDMNMIGSVDGLGVDEEIKSASFSGNMAYIVTFRQTDPLYAVDLSDPANPVVLDELKINGFSTYMQPWGDGMLLGFGQDADDNGRVTGLRLTMFDSFDPNNLKAVDVYTWNNTLLDNIEWDDREGKSESYYNSEGTYERKALLIAPEKNLIGVPISLDTYKYNAEYETDYARTSQFVFFSFEDGKFSVKGDITAYQDGWDSIYDSVLYDRALYIGDYVYTLSSNKFVASDINTLEITDELEFFTFS